MFSGAFSHNNLITYSISQVGGIVKRWGWVRGLGSRWLVVVVGQRMLYSKSFPKESGLSTDDVCRHVWTWWVDLSCVAGCGESVFMKGDLKWYGRHPGLSEIVVATTVTGNNPCTYVVVANPHHTCDQPWYPKDLHNRGVYSHCIKHCISSLIYSICMHEHSM